MCVTADGDLVGSTVESSNPDGLVEPDETQDPLAGVLAVLSSNGGEWNVIDSVPIRNAWEQVGCGVDSISIVGAATEQQDETVWREVGIDGTLRTERVVANLPADGLPPTDTMFGQGTSGVAFLREVRPGRTTRTGEGMTDFDLELFRTVILIPGPELGALTLHDQDQSEGQTSLATRLANGTIVVFDNTENEPPRMLIAE